MIKDLSNAAVLVIVAHYDDEVLYCGGLLSSTRNRVHALRLVVATGVETTSAPRETPLKVSAEERIRRKNRIGAFRAVCKQLKAESTELEVANLPQREGRATTIFESRRQLIHDRLCTQVNLEVIDLILTHGPTGEYGHAQHRCVHDAVINVAREHAKLAWCFASRDEHDYEHQFTISRKSELLEHYRDHGPQRPRWSPERDPRSSAWTKDREWFSRAPSFPPADGKVPTV